MLASSLLVLGTALHILVVLVTNLKLMLSTHMQSRVQTTADWLQCWQERLLDKQTVPVLKEFCKSRELPLGGKKDDLVKRVHAKLEEIAAEEANAVKAEGT